jgi:hypothetical protein
VKFTRDRVLQTVDTGPSSQTTTVLHPEITDLLFTNANAADGSTVALPAAYNETSTFEVDLNGNDQIYVLVYVDNLGGGGLTGVKLVIEWQSPDNTDVWVPSKEGVARDATYASNEWSVTALGSYLLASRKDMQQTHKARVRFQAVAGAADAATRIRAYWHPNSGFPGR